MRIIIQRVSQATVQIQGAHSAEIGPGLLVLLGVHVQDQREDAEWLAAKLANLRIFADEKGLMNRSVQEMEGEILIVSQFTLTASYRKGNRPSFIDAAKPEQAIPLYEHFVDCVRQISSRPVKTGQFGANMNVQLTNQGPVTIFMDSRNKD